MPFPHSYDWAALVARIQAHDATAVADLYGVFERGFRYYLWRQLGSQDLDDGLHDVFVATLDAICNGDVRQPERLMGYARTIVRRHIAHQIQSRVFARHHRGDIVVALAVRDSSNPEKAFLDEERSRIAANVLAAMLPRDREILERFYSQEQSAAEIQIAMGMNVTTFRLLKSRAKGRLEQRLRLLARRKSRLLLQPISISGSIPAAQPDAVIPYLARLT